MIPEKLTLSGFLSYRDAVTIDFSQIKVACISGANGAGKSSIFDAIIWALFGKARRNDDALIYNGMESCRVVYEFKYENTRYRIERSKRRAKGTVLEFQVQAGDGSWKPLTEAGIRATEERIRDILRLDYDTFVNASFFLQGKADMFAVQPPGKRKEILSSILGLEVWETYREEAARRRREVQQNVKVQQSILAEVVDELNKEDERRAELANLEEILSRTVELKKSKVQLVEQVRNQVRQLEADNEKMKLLDKQAESLRSRSANVAGVLAERKSSRGQYEKLIQDAEQIKNKHQSWRKLRDKLSALDAVAVQYNQLNLKRSEISGEIQAELARLGQERLSLEQSEKEIAAIRKAQSKIEQSLADKEKQIGQLQAELEKLDRSEAQLGKLKEKRADRMGENSQLRLKMNEYKDRIDHLEQLHEADCPLCGQQLSEQDRQKTLVKLKAEGKAFGDRFRANNADIERFDKSIKDLESEIAALRGLRPRLTALERETSSLRQQLEANSGRISKWEKTGAPRLSKIVELFDSGKISAALKIELAALEKKIAGLKYNHQAHEKLRKEELSLRGIENQFRELEQARTAVESLDREIAEYEKQFSMLNTDLSSIETAKTRLQKKIDKQRNTLPDIAELERDLDEIQNEENTWRQKVGAAEQLVNVLDDLRKRKSDIEQRINQYTRHIANLKMLEVSFGKDGVPALLIEQSLPQLEAQANDILDRLSSGDMSVSFETQRAFADKKREDKRQTLDIIIRDSAGSREYELFSGGEAFRINFAIRLALSRVLAQRSGARLQTLVI
ncbi:MAG: SMC family ATPase, partial [Anaerolineaceae bacterium]|nr:SMC family ATPase [Anaerolineaceae bacterium]